MMSGLAIYSADYDPRRLESAGEPPTDAAAVVAGMARFGDAPLTLLADLDGDRTALYWSFKGKRGAASSRTEYFIAAFATTADDPFRAFADALRTVQDDGWTIPHTGEPRWDLAFDLWRVPPTDDACDRAIVGRIASKLTADGPRQWDGGPMTFGMTDYHAAMGALRALAAADTEGRIAIGADGDPTALPDVDVAFLVGAEENLTPRSAPAAAVHDRAAEGMPELQEDDEVAAVQTGRRTGPRVAAGLAGVLFVLAAYSLLDPGGPLPPAPLTPRISLATLGGLFGGSLSFVAVGWWLLPDRLFGAAVATERPTVADPALPEYDTDWGAVWITYGGVWGLLFPIVFYVGHRLSGIGRTWYLLGDIATLAGAVPSMLVYLAGLFCLSLGLVALLIWRRGDGQGSPPAVDVRVIAALVAAHLLYGTSVVMTTTVPGVV